MQLSAIKGLSFLSVCLSVCLYAYFPPERGGAKLLYLVYINCTQTYLVITVRQTKLNIPSGFERTLNISQSYIILRVHTFNKLDDSCLSSCSGRSAAAPPMQTDKMPISYAPTDSLNAFIVSLPYCSSFI